LSSGKSKRYETLASISRVSEKELASFVRRHCQRMANCQDVWAPKALSYFTATFSLILCLLIAFGNLSIIIAVIVDPLKKLRSPFIYFLINLAVSDLVVGLITMPAAFEVHTDEASGYSRQYKVYLLHMSYFISATASVLSLAALSIDRFGAIRWPIEYRSRFSLSRCVAISVFIWIFSGLISLVYLKVGVIKHLMVFVHVSAVITLILLAVTYWLAYREIRQQSKELRAFDQGDDHAGRAKGDDQAGREETEEELRRVRTEKKVTRAFLYILGLFIACYVPAIIMIYILQFCDDCSCVLRHILRDSQFLLVSANSAMNPFVCTIRLGNFRRSIVEMLKCKITFKRKSPEAITMQLGSDNKAASSDY